MIGMLRGLAGSEVAARAAPRRRRGARRRGRGGRARAALSPLTALADEFGLSADRARDPARDRGTGAVGRARAAVRHPRERRGAPAVRRAPRVDGPRRAPTPREIAPRARSATRRSSATAWCDPRRRRRGRSRRWRSTASCSSCCRGASPRCRARAGAHRCVATRTLDELRMPARREGQARSPTLQRATRRRCASSCAAAPARAATRCSPRSPRRRGRALGVIDRVGDSCASPARAPRSSRSRCERAHAARPAAVRRRARAHRRPTTAIARDAGPRGPARATPGRSRCGCRLGRAAAARSRLRAARSAGAVATSATRRRGRRRSSASRPRASRDAASSPTRYRRRPRRDRARVRRGRAPPDREADADDGDAAAELDDAVRQHLEKRLGTTATRVTPPRELGRDRPARATSSTALLELIARVRHRRTVYDTWGFDRVDDDVARPHRAVLRAGPAPARRWSPA